MTDDFSGAGVGTSLYGQSVKVELTPSYQDWVQVEDPPMYPDIGIW